MFNVVHHPFVAKVVRELFGPDGQQRDQPTEWFRLGQGFEQLSQQLVGADEKPTRQQEREYVLLQRGRGTSRADII